MTTIRSEPLAEINGWLRRSFVVGVTALAVCAAGAFYAPAQFFRAYLFAYLFFLGMPLGSLALVMIHHLTGGAWGLLVRRIAEAQMKTLPLAALLFLPIGFGLRYVYPWAGRASDSAAAQGTIQALYLEPSFFCWRAAAYFLIWLLLAGFLSAWSHRQDESDDARTVWKCSKLSGIGLVLFGIALHFAAVDWIMSLQTEFTSTIFGPLVFSGQLLSAFGVSVVLFCRLAGRPEYRPVFSAKAMNDLGSLLFTLLVLWAYLVWFQFMLVWIADLPREGSWYLVRLRGGWSWLAWLLVLFHFIVPFFLLLLRDVKRNPRLLGTVAALVVFTQLLFTYFQIMPVFQARGIGDHWMDFLAPLGIGGIWLACVLGLLERRSLLPRYDLNYRQAILLREKEEEESAREEAVAHA